jgi:hypothetical protein
MVTKGSILTILRPPRGAKSEALIAGRLGRALREQAFAPLRLMEGES